MNNLGPLAHGKTGATPLDIAEMEKSLLGDVNKSFGSMGKELMASKMVQHQVFQESAAQGGPTNAHDAISNLMDYCKVGIREASRTTGVKKKLLLGMLAGRLEMPQPVFDNLYALFQKKQPTLFDDVKPTNSKLVM